jgi:hypothetical protein
VKVIASWLRQRSAHVIVGGEKSRKIELRNMVFQGTVLGPPLWNLFYEDARQAVNEWWFKEVVYADDLNAYRIFGNQVENCTITICMNNCQSELHKWGQANQVVFDPTKESKHILSYEDPDGDSFRLLGITWDVRLTMKDTVDEVVSEANWKMHTILKTRRFYCDAELIGLYKAHLLSFLEYRTAAVYHARRDVLERLDRVQQRFLRDCGVDEETALFNFNLAPLAVRRDIAMLGLIHRTVLGGGSQDFKEHFKLAGQSEVVPVRRHRNHLKDLPHAARTSAVKRSALGLIAVYNLLPAHAAESLTVPLFQKALQIIVKQRCQDGCEDWRHTLSPRIPLLSHPLI